MLIIFIDLLKRVKAISHPHPQPGHGLQLWINLASKDKMVEPRYQELPSKDVPRVTKDGVTAIVIAGEALGIKVSE